MSRLSDSSVGSFRTLWQEHCGTTLTEEQARTYAERWLDFVQFVLEPDIHQIQQEEPP